MEKFNRPKFLLLIFVIILSVVLGSFYSGCNNTSNIDSGNHSVSGTEDSSSSGGKDSSSSGGKDSSSSGTKEDENEMAPQAYGPTPTAGQMAYYKQELAGFVHFGVNTYTGKQWGDGTEDPDIFNPTNLDTDQWIEIFKNAGFKRVLLTAKHHDGFNLYPTEVTSHSVASSSWKDGKGDVLKEFSESCKKYDMDMGVYLSPWDQNIPCYSTDVAPDYNDVYVKQIEEIFKNYGGKDGKIVEFWMDGACGKTDTRPKYDIERWWKTLFKLNPDIVFQQNYGAPLRWVGNEKGYASEESWQTMNKEYVWNLYDSQGKEDKAYLHKGEPYVEGKAPSERNADVWSIPEVDVSIRAGWFYDSKQSPKSGKELAEIYFTSVGRGSPLLLNIPPNKEGKFDDKDIASMQSFRKILDNTFAVDYAKHATIESDASRGTKGLFKAENVLDDNYDTYWTLNDEQTKGSFTVTFDKPVYMDVIELQEYIPLGQRISSFKTEVMVNGKWQSFGDGKTIGYKRLIKGAPVTAEKVRVTITGAYAVPLINNFGVYKADKSIEEKTGSSVPGKIEAESFSLKKGNVFSEKKAPENGYNLGGIKTGDYTIYKGVNFDVMPTSFSVCYAGEKNSSVVLRLDSADGPVIATATVKATGSYGSDSYSVADFDVTYSGVISGKHDLYLCLTAGINIDYFELSCKDMFEFDMSSVTVRKGDEIKVDVIRKNPSDSEVSVTVETSPGNAVHGKDYLDITETLVFKSGETRKSVTIKTVKNSEKGELLRFIVALKKPVGGYVLPSTLLTVTIED